MDIMPDSREGRPPIENRPPKSAPGIMQWDHQKLKAAEAKIEQLQRGMVRIDELHEVAGRKRSLSKEAYEELKANLAQNPLAHAIVVRERERGGYEIIAGHNRAQAYKELGREEIEADIRQFDDEHVYEAAFYSNLFNQKLSDYEKYLGFKELQARTNQTQEQIAKKAGVSRDLVTSLFYFDSLPKEAKEIIAGNPMIIGYNSVKKMAKATPDKVIEVVKLLSSGKVNELQAVALLKPEQEQVMAKRIEPLVIKAGDGKTKVAVVTRKEGLLAINFKDESKAAELFKRIEEIIKAL